MSNSKERRPRKEVIKKKDSPGRRLPSLTAHETPLESELRGLWMLGEHEIGELVYNRARREGRK